MSFTSEASLNPVYCYKAGDDRALLTRAIESEATNRQCVQYLRIPFVLRPPRVPDAMRAVEQALDAMQTFIGLDLPPAISPLTTRAQEKATSRPDEDPDPMNPPVSVSECVLAVSPMCVLSTFAARLNCALTENSGGNDVELELFVFLLEVQNASLSNLP